MSPIALIKKIYSSVKNPFSLPSAVGQALGLDTLEFQSFEEFIKKVTSAQATANRVRKFTPRERVDLIFQAAEKKEIFHAQSLFYFYFGGAWLGISLHFDESACLRRLYLIHESIDKEELELDLAL